ncbi:hypothetical protein L9F63_002190, partial [Diploptera punctata]
LYLARAVGLGFVGKDSTTCEIHILNQKVRSFFICKLPRIPLISSNIAAVGPD